MPGDCNVESESLQEVNFAHVQEQRLYSIKGVSQHPGWKTTIEYGIAEMETTIEHGITEMKTTIEYFHWNMSNSRKLTSTFFPISLQRTCSKLEQPGKALCKRRSWRILIDF